MTLSELADRCEAATGSNQNLDAVIHTQAFGFEPRRAGVGWPDENAPVVPAFPGWKSLPSYTASIDAAMTLVDDRHLMSVWRAMLACLACDGISREDLPRLICAAALRARGA
jgi:hypothetical protein